MLTIVAKKNYALTQKIEFTSKRTTREKLLSYLSSQAKVAGGSRFSIPFNRQELADYLSVDRSAMSAELSRMKKDGLLKYEKNRFELMKKNYTSRRIFMRRLETVEKAQHMLGFFDMRQIALRRDLL
jgi:CRP-like cAMP-binding protein